MEMAKLAVIGGTGVYDFSGLEGMEEYYPVTPFGRPSDVIRIGTLEGERVAFLARHARGHRLLPGEIPFRANIWALKSLGVERVVAISACGSMKEAYKPGDVVVPDQVFDRTRRREYSFFGEGLVAHISFADPFCPELSRWVGDAVEAAGGTVHRGGVYLIIEGPRFSSRGESLIFRQWGVDIIGMTIIPEAQLAREAEMCYAVMAHVTDYDCWHTAEEAVCVELVFERLARNAELAQKAVRELIRRLHHEQLARHCTCGEALRSALVTPLEQVPNATKEKLAPLLAKYIHAQQ